MIWFILVGAIAIALFVAFTKNPKGQSPVQRLTQHADAMERKIAEIEQLLAEAEREEERAESAKIPGEDDYDAWVNTSEFSAYPSRPLAVDMLIDFADRNGKETHRRITTKHYTSDGTNGFIEAYCHLRKARRHFIFSRITRAVDPNTSEVIANIPTWLNNQFSTSPYATVERLLSQHSAALHCFLHICRADGAFRAKEKDLIREFLTDGQADDLAITEVITTMATWPPLSAIGYGKEIRRLAETPESYKQKVLQTAEALLATDKSINSAEAHALKRLKDAIS